MENVINQVLSLSDLRPSPEVNRAFSGLVDVVIASSEPATCFCDQRTLSQLQHRCAEAEGEMERAWARRIINSNDPLRELESFPYIDNYQELTHREVKLLEDSGLRLISESKVLVIGSGPLPLSAWFIWRSTGALVVNVDNLALAIDLSRRLAEVLRWPCQSILADGRQVSLPVEAFDVIYVAALAGENLANK